MSFSWPISSPLSTWYCPVSKEREEGNEKEYEWRRDKTKTEWKGIPVSHLNGLKQIGSRVIHTRLDITESLCVCCPEDNHFVHPAGVLKIPDVPTDLLHLQSNEREWEKAGKVSRSPLQATNKQTLGLRWLGFTSCFTHTCGSHRQEQFGRGKKLYANFFNVS